MLFIRLMSGCDTPVTAYRVHICTAQNDALAFDMDTFTKSKGPKTGGTIFAC